LISLDQAEIKIISFLQEDARFPFVKMAKCLRVTEGTIRRKFNRLIKHGIIKTTAICDPYALGFDAPAFVGVRAVQNKAKSLAKKIAQMPEVQFVALTTGDYEIMTHVVAESNKLLFEILIKISDLDGVMGTNTFIMLDIYKQNWNLGNILNQDKIKEKEKK
jgi:Lrp/AsnC family transcriptional regulator for asnA, asnC and gidA